MKKTITYLIILLLALTKGASSQVASIQTLDGTYGSTTINVNLNGFIGSNTIGAITLSIGYDSTIASFTGLTPGLISSGIYANKVGNKILISFANVPAVSVDGVAFVLNFNYTGGSCSLPFNQGCEIANGSGAVIQTTYNNGAITQPTITTASATIDNNSNGIYGSQNQLPITFSETTPELASVGAINLAISYNTNVLQYVGIDAGDLTGAIGNATNGVVSIAWSSSTAVDITSLTNKLKLKFNYLGGASNVSFTGTNIISNAYGVQLPVNLVNGSIVEPPATADSVNIVPQNPYSTGQFYWFWCERSCNFIEYCLQSQ